jgi:S-adenosylmethionine/arginine decarboxylase-like enzyme
MKTFEEWKSGKNESKDDHFWGYHLIIDMTGCNDNVAKKDKIREFVKDLVKKIKMKAVGEPVIRYLLPGKPNAGYSMMQLIETSDITAHFMTKTRTVYCDIFSCKEYDPKVAEKVVKEYFEPKHIKTKFMIRDAAKKGGV